MLSLTLNTQGERLLSVWMLCTRSRDLDVCCTVSDIRCYHVGYSVTVVGD